MMRGQTLSKIWIKVSGNFRRNWWNTDMVEGTNKGSISPQRHKYDPWLPDDETRYYVLNQSPSLRPPHPVARAISDFRLEMMAPNTTTHPCHLISP